MTPNAAPKWASPGCAVRQALSTTIALPLPVHTTLRASADQIARLISNSERESLSREQDAGAAIT